MNPSDKPESTEHMAGQRLKAEQSLLQQAAAELRQPVAPSIAGQLRAARRTALAQEAQPRSWWQQGGQKNNLPVWGAALAAGVGALAIALFMFVQSPATVSSQPALQAKAAGGDSGAVLLEDLSIMAAQDDLQFYQDLELMQWLAEEEGLDAQG